MTRSDEILKDCLLLDLETSPDGKLLKVGAICGGEERFLKGRFARSEVDRVLDELGAGAKYVLGHNILDHDLPILQQQFSQLQLHLLPTIDTLFLSPIAFPENPYHYLVKDDKLLNTALNDPVADAKNSGKLFRDQCAVFEELLNTEKELVRFYAWAFYETMLPFFLALDAQPLSDQEAQKYFSARAAEFGCKTAAAAISSELVSTARAEGEVSGLGRFFRRRNNLQNDPTDSSIKTPSAYALAWLRVAGSNSIIPPWVHYRFPAVVAMVRRLRDKGCSDPSCSYCQDNHNPQKQLKRFFGFDDFRAKPAANDGGSLQEAIIRAGMNDDPILAILPTGGGKSLCYQLPALVRNRRLGVLSIVISPLQALMKDQIANLNRITESSFAAALYGMLTPPERGDVIERVRMGDIAVLYVSPEQLRNSSFRKVIKQREIGCWIFDEAHCLSRWGHSFRPDYLYASRFIRELAKQQNVPCPPVACFTATAKQDVVAEISEHFQKELSQELQLFDGGAERTNLDFEVQIVNPADKRDRVKELLLDRLPLPEDGASVVYCATRQGTEDMAEFLRRVGFSVEAFHAGLEPPEKRRIQEEFIAGDIQHICATNAFGMGIDKENVRLVIHADIPGSLENYLQEAGRAGRDRQQAHCVLLYDKQDIETQFSMSAFSQLTRKDIAQILRGLRRAKKDEKNSVIITAGEILRDEGVDTAFNTTDPMATTKVNTAVSMLERGSFVERNENRTRVLEVQPLVKSVQDAVEKVGQLGLSDRIRRQWLDILGAIYNSDPNEGISADELAELPSMASEEKAAPDLRRGLQHDTLPIMRILNDMVNAGLIDKDTMMSAYVKVRCANSAEKIFTDICALEKALLAVMREEEPDADGWMIVGLRRLNQRLLDEGFSCAPETIINLLKSLALDGKGLAGRRGSIDLKYRDKEHYRVKLQRSWESLEEIAHKRHAVAGIVLSAISKQIPSTSSGEQLVKFSEGDLINALKSDMFIAAQIKDFSSAIERGLLYLHEQKSIILQQGLAVFRQAMTIAILPEAKGRRYTKGDYSPLHEHYKERFFQIHVMHEYAILGLEKIQNARALVSDYFTMNKVEFVRRFFPGREKILNMATTAESYREIVDQLNNGVQVAVVAANVQDNMLVLAGPGSGKTRVIAHRCAYLLRVERVRPREILVVCFNRSAAISLRRRIMDLVGRDAFGVTIQTYHGLAMRLIGASFSGRMEKGKEMPDLDAVIPEATKMLRGECDIPGLERDEMRERLLAGYNHILIDEYQDIDQPQYDMVSAIAGRTLESEKDDTKLSVLAVGDDDQNIYTFRGANVQFIRQFEKDYEARTHFLIENYRSTKSIINASNMLIALNEDRMKTDRPIQINGARRSESAGHPVRIVCCPDAMNQARFILNSIKAQKKAGGSIAVFSRTKRELHSIRAALEYANIPSTLAAENKGNTPLHRMREPQALFTLIKGLKQKTTTATRLQSEFQALECYKTHIPWCRIVDDILREWEDETHNNDRTPNEAVDFIYEALYERQRERIGDTEVYLSTVHSAKGLEFDHVILLGKWDQPFKRTELEEERRLYYVGMTRARETLTLCELKNTSNPHTQVLRGDAVIRSVAEFYNKPSDQVLNVNYGALGLSDVWISYPVDADNARYVRQEISRLEFGSMVGLKASGNRIFITNERGHHVGAFSRASSAKWMDRLSGVKEVRVKSVVNWRKNLLDEKYVKESYPDEWEVPLVEIIWVEQARKDNSAVVN
ncbi:RecQ family ATP-dependent DNA helicase [Pontiellaceae bacterium B12227]|nr:RecQ family ATP-dependent DNA helicase [Pontiellaceae bacterium B12227]